ncbi:MAG: hypothetical protein KAT15_30945, partial [Bacteroidales bacterium]|nr:hypothetical protein [Bacteroidales bacterium]
MKTIPILLLLSSFSVILAQVPEGGIMLNSETGTTYQRIGRCSITEESVSGQPFIESLQITTGSDVSNAWDAQVEFPAVAGIEEGDVVLVAFYARTISSGQETGEGELNVCIEHNVSWAKELYYHISIGQ